MIGNVSVTGLFLSSTPLKVMSALTVNIVLKAILNKYAAGTPPFDVAVTVAIFANTSVAKAEDAILFNVTDVLEVGVPPVDSPDPVDPPPVDAPGMIKLTPVSNPVGVQVPITPFVSPTML